MQDQIDDLREHDRRSRGPGHAHDLNFGDGTRNAPGLTLDDRVGVETQDRGHGNGSRRRRAEEGRARGGGSFRRLLRFLRRGPRAQAARTRHPWPLGSVGIHLPRRMLGLLTGGSP